MTDAILSYEEMHQIDLLEYPYAIYHPDDGDFDCYERPKFKTWQEALSQQKAWNKDVPGHRAYRRDRGVKESHESQ